jgi:hypothetical protein
LGVALYPLIILKCDINSKEFDDIIRMCYDIFYEWYKSNSTLLNKVDLDDYEKILQLVMLLSQLWEN